MLCRLLRLLTNVSTTLNLFLISREAVGCPDFVIITYWNNVELVSHFINGFEVSNSFSHISWTCLVFSLFQYYFKIQFMSSLFKFCAIIYNSSIFLNRSNINFIKQSKPCLTQLQFNWKYLFSKRIINCFT